MTHLTPKDLLKYRLQCSKVRVTVSHLYDTLWELKMVEVITTDEHDKLMNSLATLNHYRYELQDAVSEANYQLYLLGKQGATA